MLRDSGAHCLVLPEATAEREMPGGTGGGKSVLVPAGPGADDRQSRTVGRGAEGQENL